MRAIACVALVGSALAAVACGDGSPQALTRAQFIAATDARCKDINARTRALNGELVKADRDATGRLATTAQRGDVDAFEATTEQQQDIVTRARALAGSYGFKECGSSKSDPG